MKPDLQVFFKVMTVEQRFNLRVYRQNVRVLVDTAPLKKMGTMIEIRSASYPENKVMYGIFFVRGRDALFDDTEIRGSVSTLEEVFNVLLFGEPRVKILQMAEMRL